MLYDLHGYVITQLGVEDAILGLLKRVVHCTTDSVPVQAWL